MGWVYWVLLVSWYSVNSGMFLLIYTMLPIELDKSLWRFYSLYYVEYAVKIFLSNSMGNVLYFHFLEKNVKRDSKMTLRAHTIETGAN